MKNKNNMKFSMLFIKKNILKIIRIKIEIIERHKNMEYIYFHCIFSSSSFSLLQQMAIIGIRPTSLRHCLVYYLDTCSYCYCLQLFVRFEFYFSYSFDLTPKFDFIIYLHFSNYLIFFYFNFFFIIKHIKRYKVFKFIYITFYYSKNQKHKIMIVIIF